MYSATTKQIKSKCIVYLYTFITVPVLCVVKNLIMIWIRNKHKDVGVERERGEKERERKKANTMLLLSLNLYHLVTKENELFNLHCKHSVQWVKVLYVPWPEFQKSIKREKEKERILIYLVDTGTWKFILSLLTTFWYNLFFFSFSFVQGNI